MKVSRFEFFSRLGAVTVADDLLRQTFDEYGERQWRENLDDSPHGARWSTSFHSSSFPGDDERWCPRYQLYNLLDTPDKEPAPRRLQAQGELGKAIELMIVSRFGAADVLLTADQTEDDEFQTLLTDEERWLTCAPDCVVVPRGWDRPHVIEVKTKKREVLEQMQRRERGPDDKHVRQLKTQIAMIREAQKEGFTDGYLASDGKPLDLCADGTVYYLARDDDPTSVTWEFLYSHDPSFWAAGLEKLEFARDSFLRGEIPPHPFDGKEWSIEPCKWCKFKRNVCKPDHKAGVTMLRDSHALKWAAEVRGEYDYDDQRKQVLERWGAEDNERQVDD